MRNLAFRKPTNSTVKFVPQLAPLETRLCPAVSYSVVGTTLVASGDGANDVVKLKYDGNGNVTGDFVGAADHFLINTRGGVDQVEFELIGNLVRPMTLRINTAK